MGTKPNWGRGIGMALASLGGSMQEEQVRKQRMAEIEQLRQQEFMYKQMLEDQANPVLYHANPQVGPTPSGAPQMGLPDMMGPQQGVTWNSDIRSNDLNAPASSLKAGLLRSRLGVPEADPNEGLVRAIGGDGKPYMVPPSTALANSYRDPDEDTLPLNMPGGGVRQVPASKYRNEVSSVATQTGMTPVYGQSGLVESWDVGRPTSKTHTLPSVAEQGSFITNNFGNPGQNRVGALYDATSEPVAPSPWGQLATAAPDSFAAGRNPRDPTLGGQIMGDVLGAMELTRDDLGRAPDIYSDFGTQINSRLNEDGWMQNVKGKTWKQDRSWKKDQTVSAAEFQTTVARKYIIEEMSKVLKNDVPSVTAASLFKYAEDNGITMQQLVDSLTDIHPDERRYLLKAAKMDKKAQGQAASGPEASILDELSSELGL